MTDTTDIPDDDLSRDLHVADPKAEDIPHLSVVGDTYTVLLSGADTGGRYCLIDMHIPDGGGPPPHRHDFEESFTLLEGRLDFTFRGDTRSVEAPATVHIPANAPHGFANTSGATARALCICAPAGQDAFFAEVGDPVGSRTASPPDLTDAEKAERMRKGAELAPKYRTELLT